MGILGLSSLDGLISLLLIETGWWSKSFLEHVFNYIYFVVRHEIPVGFTEFGYVLLCFLKFLGQGILWYAFLRKQAGNSATLIKTWYWMSVGLDLALITLTSGMNARKGMYFATVCSVFGNIVFRCCIWIAGLRLVSDISTQDTEKSLFPEGFIAYVTDRKRVQGTLTILLISEFTYYTFSLAGTILSQFGIWGLLLPLDTVNNPVIAIILAIPVVVALFQLIGVRQSWNVFLKCWLAIYILINIIAYTWFNSVLLYDSSIRSMTISVLSLTVLGGKLTLLVFALGLKFGIVFGSYLFIFKSDQPYEKQVTDEEKPLICPQITNTK